MPNPGDYTIGWVCALSKEFTAAKTMLDENHPPCSIPNRDTNQYALGRIGRHNVVIAVLPDGEYGLSSAANVATNMLNAFPNIRIGLLVGIGGGAPTSRKDIRLGDVVVSSAGQGTGGIFQYDFGRTVQDMEFQTTGFLNRAPTALRTAISALKTEHEMKGHRIEETIGHGLQRYPRLRKKYSRPPKSHDRLYLSTSVHPPKDSRTCIEACGEGTEAEPKLVRRAERYEEDDDPEIHYGIIASANQLMKDAKIRDKLSSERGIICFEMEAAGLVNTFPCIVIRGICDYSDTHKNDEWQGYAAMTAAAYAKELLSKVSVTRIEDERCIKEVLGHLSSTIDEINTSIEGQSEVINVINSRAEAEQYREIIDQLPYVKDAAFDSYSEEHNPKCLEDTRVDLLTQVSQWVENDDSKTVFWLNGMAGTGKSTISRTVAQRLFNKNMLGASFFFKRGYADQGSATKFCTTIARQLAMHQECYGTFFQAAIEKDPDIGNKGLRLQFEKLIMEPLADAAKHQSAGNLNIAIIVDALDECNSEKDIRLLISLFSQLGTLHNMKLRALLTSRPELPIRLGFNSVTGTFRDFILHQIPRPVIEHDISVFFKYELRKIVLEWNNSVAESRRLSTDWPGDDNLHILIERAIPLFIFAATMCRFISDRNSGPNTRLNQIIGSTTWTAGDQMQATYAPILDQLLIGLSPEGRKDAIREFKMIVGAVVILETPLPVVVLSRLLDIDQDRIHDRLDKLHSVLDIPQSPEVPIRPFHLSFRDYLINEGGYPGNEFTIDYKKGSRRLSADCLRVMKAHLKTDICDLRHPGTTRVDINRDLINSHLPPELQYACLYWVKHQEGAITEPVDTQLIMEFLKIHLLHWIEALVLLNRPWEISGLLKTLCVICKNDLPLTEFLEDALRVLSFSMATVDTHPLQLYSYALLFAPESSLVKWNFKTEIPAWINPVPNMNADWDSCLQVFARDTLEYMQSITFVPDTTRLLLSFRYGHAEILDWDTGECVEMPYRSPVLSPDGKVLAVPTSRSLVEVREFQSGTIWAELPRDCDTHAKLFFSPNSQLLVVSTQSAWQVWDWAARTYLYGFLRSDEIPNFLCKHIDHICFSTDSALLMTSEPPFHIIRIWNSLTGECLFQRTISCHPAFTFTADSKMFILMSTTNEIEVWSTSTYSRIRRCVFPYLLPVYAEFQVSPDSSLLAFPLESQCIQILSLTADQHLSGSYINHNGLDFFRFAPDSKHLIVDDSTSGIQVWSVSTRSSFHMPIGHGDTIDSAVFSTDGKIIVITSQYAARLQVWDWEREVTNSRPGLGLATRVREISRVIFSPDSTKLAVVYPDVTQIYGITPGTLEQLFEVYRGGAFDFRFSSDSKLFSFHRDWTHILVFDAGTGVCVFDSYTEDRLFDTSFSEDSQWLAVTTVPKDPMAAKNARIMVSKKVGDAFKLQHTFENSLGYSLVETRFSANASFLAMLDGVSLSVLVWELKRSFDEPYVIARCDSIAAISSSFLALGDSKARTITIWHMASRQCYKIMKWRPRQNGSAYAFSQSERLLGIVHNGLIGGLVELLDWRTGIPLVKISGLCVPGEPIEDEPFISFLPGDAGIRTQSGIVELPKEILAPPFPPSSLKVIHHTPLFRLCWDSGWVEWRGKKLLKLPAEYDRDNAVVSNTQIVMTLSSRRLVMIGILESLLFDALLDKD